MIVTVRTKFKDCTNLNMNNCFRDACLLFFPFLPALICLKAHEYKNLTTISKADNLSNMLCFSSFWKTFFSKNLSIFFIAATNLTSSRKRSSIASMTATLKYIPRSLISLHLFNVFCLPLFIMLNSCFCVI